MESPDVLDFVVIDDEFDPLAVDDTEINQDEMDDDNPYDTIDFPTMRNMPDHPKRDAVYSPGAQGSAQAALRLMIERNPNRRPVLLKLITLCEGGCASSEIEKAVAEWQTDNWSVYEPMTFCRMLERAGALTLEIPEVVNEVQEDESGNAYMQITECVDPIWHATPEGLEVVAEYESGAPFRRIVLAMEHDYLEVYEAVMEALDEAPRTQAQVAELVDSFEVVKKPRRFGAHFLDVLERVDAVHWRDHGWHLTEFGKAMIPEVKAARVM